MKTLVPILGDQLTPTIASLRDADREDTVVLMMEVAEETGYVRHHKQKLAYILSAMRHHAAALRDAGWTVDYVALDDPDNGGSFTAEVARALERHGARRIVVTEAGEWRVAGMLDGWSTRFGVPVEIRADDRFLCSHADFAAWADGRSQLTMEYFYRDMRRRTDLLMVDGKPEGGRWNFDKDNRKPAPGGGLFVPKALAFEPDAITRDVLALVERRFGNHPGSLDGFAWAVTAADAEAQAAHFFAEALPLFGDYEDAMLTGERHLWHSILSPYINSGLLDPIDLCRRAEAEYRARRAPLNAVEGYIRQIIGWREYMRGIYWREGPDYVDRNFLNHHRALPGWYWTGNTDMHCLKEAIGQTLATAHAHHIQRLMVTGNFALLIGADPAAVHRWYLEVYIDAYEWVELPNTLGMSQFGDGGLLSSKPYISSGAYIDRMSDYCGRCRYDVKKRVGDDACPFNALYWDFLARHEDRLGDNPRLRMPYATWKKQSAQSRNETRAQAKTFLQALDSGGEGGY
ncbi:MULTISPECIES: cryptochrome/photolyase family protein [unclassified Sphingomonas]|jgi:deoxyribodipyrimidine photolyase-related protein|uniref:cryptochrome/photolyase family protein n=1 Tax=unclassified Sphingomonas TaxID=196159 RepID=UPI000E108849|nr:MULTISPECIES: cryptochrome/photolyase family protein [unclassified Sphingomonas]AXJ95754.1 cryptochrome/photolyase family protein [Sphingomonas sp. FARSPH]